MGALAVFEDCGADGELAGRQVGSVVETRAHTAVMLGQPKWDIAMAFQPYTRGKQLLAPGATPLGPDYGGSKGRESVRYPHGYHREKSLAGARESSLW